MNCPDNSNSYTGSKINCLDNFNKQTAFWINCPGNPINRQYTKSIIWTIPTNTKSLLQTMPLGGSLLNQLPLHFKISVHTDCFVTWNDSLMIYIWAQGLGGIETSYVRTQKYIAKAEVSRPFLLMPWTIDLSIDCCPYSRVTKLSMNWKCPSEWCQRLSSNWSCLDNWSWVLCLSIGFIRILDVGYCLKTGIVLTNNIGEELNQSKLA